MDELRNVIYEDWKMWEGAIKKDGEKFTKDSFQIKIYPYFGKLDKRCGWYSQMVAADLEEKDKFIPLGFLSEPMP